MTNKIDEAISEGGMPAGAGETEGSLDRVRTIFGDLVEATRSAAEQMLDEQKRRAAERIAGITEAVRSAAHSLERSEDGSVAFYANRAADQIDQFVQPIRDREWSEILADTEEFAKQRPMLFLLGATALGFLAARLLWVPSERQRHEMTSRRTDFLPDRGETVPVTDFSPHRGETDPITAAVSKQANVASDQARRGADHSAGMPATPGIR
jgi:hypothetical protein